VSRRNIVFQLSMPSNNAWDGRWSGAERFYVIVRPVPASRIESLSPPRSFGYDFGDGWRASVAVREAGSRNETRKLRKASDGFCGYDWMIDQIIEHGRILPREEQGKEIPF